MTFSKTITLGASSSAQTEKGELLTIRAGHTDLVPTGIYLKAGETIDLNVETGRLVSFQIGTVGDYEGKTTGGKHEGNLIPGENRITAETDGILYLSTSSLVENSQVTITAPDTVEQIPLFKLGEHTLEDFQNMLEQSPDANAIELQGERVLLTFTPETIAKNLSDPIKVLEAWDRIANIEDEIAGLVSDSDSIAAISNNLYHLVESKDGYLYATGGRIGVRYGGKVLDHEVLLTDAWGPYHELGHQHQQAPWTWTNMGEVTNNIYSLFTKLSLTGHVPLKWTKVTVESLQESGVYDQVNNFNNFSGQAKVSMLWRLYEAFGEEFYQILNQHYRTMDPADRPDSSAEKMSQFAVNASRISGYDLTDYFDAWKLKFSDAARAEIAAMSLKEMPLDLENYAIHDENGQYKGGLNLAELEYVVPEAIANNGLFIKAGDTLTVDDLISYNPDEIQSAEIRSLPGAGKIGMQYAYVNIEDHDGNRNVIPVQIFAVPADYAEASSEEIIARANEYMSSLNEIDDADLGTLSMHLNLLRMTSGEAPAEISDDVKQLYDERVDRAIAYVEALTKEDLVIEDGYAKLEISREAYDHLIDTGSIAIKMKHDGGYAGKAAINSNNITNYYNARTQVGEDTVVIYSNKNKAENLETADFIITFNPKGGYHTEVESRISVTTEEIGESVNIDLSTVLKDAYVELLDGEYAALTFNDEIFEAFKEDGDYTVEMFVNDEYKGTVSESGTESSSVALSGAGQYTDGTEDDILFLNQADITGKDKITFAFSYRQNGSDEVQEQTVEFTGEDIGLNSVVDIDDILQNARVGLTENAKQYAGVFFDPEFVERMIEDGDLRLRFYINDDYRGEVREGWWGGAEGNVRSYYAGQYSAATSGFFTKRDLNADDEVRFFFQYQQEGSDEVQRGEITATAAELGIAAADSQLAFQSLIEEDVFSLI